MNADIIDYYDCTRAELDEKVKYANIYYKYNPSTHTCVSMCHLLIKNVIEPTMVHFYLNYHIFLTINLPTDLIGSVRE